MQPGKRGQSWGTGQRWPQTAAPCGASRHSLSLKLGCREGRGLTGGVEGGGRAISPTVLHGKHLHKLLLEDGQQVGDAVIQADVEDELEKGRGWG